MSQPHYSDYPQQQQYYPDSYDSANTMHPPNHYFQSHTSGYGCQTQYYDTSATTNTQAVDNSSTLVQPYSYSDSNYAMDNTANGYSSYDSTPNYPVAHHPDSVSQIPHQGVPQYGDAAPGQTWTGPAQYAEVTTVQPGDLHDQRRGSCASMDTNDTWYSHDNANGEHYDYPQQAVAEQDHHVGYYQQQETGNFGMYSPTQHSRIQELARTAPYEPTDQWAPAAPVPQGNLEAPYGTLPLREPQAQYERRSSDAYQGFDNGSTSHPHLTHTSPVIQSHPPSSEPHQQPVSPPATKPGDLYYQQRQAATYQHGLRVQQELKYQLSGQLEQFEATHRHQENFTVDQNYTYAHDTPHHQNHPAHHQRQSSSSSDHRLPSAPIVPSQARERPAACAHSSPEVEEKKESPPKKPALACLFCRKRKIACGPPPPDSPDRTCNQCSRRKQPCEYPTESRRGIRRTPKEPAPEEPAGPSHRFVNGDGPSHELTGAIRNNPRSRRK